MIKIAISPMVISLQKSNFSLIYLPSCYRTVWYWTACYRKAQKANRIQSCSYVSVRSLVLGFLAPN